MPYAQFTRAQLRLLLQQRYESTPFWTDVDANLALNHALRVWNLLTSYWRRRIVVANQPDDPLVSIPGTLVQQTAITWQGRPMVGVSVAELQMIARNMWYARAGDGNGVPARPLFWAPVGLNLVQIYPATAAQGSLEVDGVRQTPVLTGEGQFVDVGPEELDTLLGYALHVCAMKAGPAFLERTKPQLESFIAAAVSRNHLLKRTRWYTLFQKEGYAWSCIPAAPAVGTPEDALPGGGAV
jgi:hypothetical protein